jgi:hypothetical protein
METVSCIGDYTYIQSGSLHVLWISHYIFYQRTHIERYMNISTIFDASYSFHTFISSYNMSYILCYFITSVINIMKCSSKEWLTASTIFNRPQSAYQSPVQSF